MRRYEVETLSEGKVKYFFIRDCDTMEIVLLPSKYLKHKIKANRSPNTVKRAAFAICYYLEYLKEIPMEPEQVYELNFESQNDHFTGMPTETQGNGQNEGARTIILLVFCSG